MIDFSTMTMRSDEGREAWKNQLAALCGRATTLSFFDFGFEASIKTREVGGISIGHFRHNASEIIHHERTRADSQCQHMMLIMQMGGRVIMSQGGRETEVGSHRARPGGYLQAVRQPFRRAYASTGRLPPVGGTDDPVFGQRLRTAATMVGA